MRLSCHALGQKTTSSCLIQQFKEIHLTQLISICHFLLKSNEIDQFDFGDEKCVVYNNVNRKRSWVMQEEPIQTTPKAQIREKKILCCQFGGIIILHFVRSKTRQTERFSSRKAARIRVLFSSTIMQKIIGTILGYVVISTICPDFALSD